MVESEQMFFGVILNRVYFYGAVLIVPIGLTLNLLQFIVYMSKDFKKANIGFLMRIYIVSESIALFWGNVVYLYLPSIGYDLSNISNISCFLYLFLARVFIEIPFYFQIFITFLNFLSVTYRSRFITLNKKPNLVKCFIVISFVICFINIPRKYS